MDKLKKTSLLRGFTARESEAVSWVMVVNHLTGGALRELTERYRQTRDWHWKAAQLCITPACRLNGRGKEAADVDELTGVTMVDLDHVEGDIEELRARVNADPHTFLSYVTVSGNGLRILCRYEATATAEADGTNAEKGNDTPAHAAPNDYSAATTGDTAPAPAEADAALYAEAFLAANCHYAELTGLPFDEKCCNVNRLSALCHDPRAFFRPDAQPFTVGCWTDTAAPCPADEDGPNTAPHPDDNTPRYGHAADAHAGSPAIATATGSPAAGNPAHAAAAAAPLSPVDYAVRVVESHGESYVRGNRNTYIMKCTAMMNRLGVTQAEAERWALGHDLGEREVRAIVKSVYGLYARQHATFDMPRSVNTCKPALLRGLSHTHARANLIIKGNDGYMPREDGSDTADDFSAGPLRFRLPEGFRWPAFMQQMVDCGENEAQRDVLTLAVIVVAGFLLARGRTLCTRYSRRLWYPVLQMFVVAPPASGKSVITWARKLADTLHARLSADYRERRQQYERAKAAYDSAGKQRAQMERPEEPRMKLALLPGNITAPGLIELLDTNDGAGLICEAEADTLSAMLNSDYGWSDILRKCFEGDTVSIYRRTDKEYREVRGPRLSVLVSGTPDQVQPLVSSAANGQFSRALYLTMPQQDAFVNQFDREATDIESRFADWGAEWQQVADSLPARYGRLELRLSPEQQEAFNTRLSQLYHHAAGTHERGYMKSSVAREGINLLRVASVVALMRALETGRGIAPDPAIPAENVKDGLCSRHVLALTDDDLGAVLALAEPLYRNACRVLTLLPETAVAGRKLSPSEAVVQSLPLEFTRAEAVEMGGQMGVAPSSVDSAIARMVARDQLRKTDKGRYVFNKTVKNGSGKN